MDKITRRLFLRNTAVAGAAVATVAVPPAAATETMAPKELVELRLAQFAEAMNLLVDGKGSWVAFTRQSENEGGPTSLVYRSWHDADGEYHDEDII